MSLKSNFILGLIIVLIIITCGNMIEPRYSSKARELFYSISTKPIVWVYWENIGRSTYPTYIDLCLSIMKEKFSSYNLIILDSNSIRTYLPDLPDDFETLGLITAQKVDYYRIKLLKTYGGVWIDADIIVMRDINPIFNKLAEGYDYVGFGCTGDICTNGYGRPSNWVMGSVKQGQLVSKCLEILD